MTPSERISKAKGMNPYQQAMYRFDRDFWRNYWETEVPMIPYAGLAAWIPPNSDSHNYFAGVSRG